jgi:hypothetical protein
MTLCISMVPYPAAPAGDEEGGQGRGAGIVKNRYQR